MTGGQTLFVEVGGAGDDGFDTGAGGFNGGGMGDPRTGSGPAGGGGGGASDVRTAPYSAGLAPDPRLLVASGGGGAGAPTVMGGGLPGYYVGGAGGAAGQQGAEGEFPCFSGTGGGGLPGTAGSGGSGGGGGTGGCEQGELPGQQGGDGALGRGGGGSTKGGDGGGGGGGGRYGGGQGGQGVFDPKDGLFDGTGGGGGGGSSLVPAGGSVAANMAGLPPQVTISYTVAGGFRLTAPVQAKLHLVIAGPHAVAAGRVARYVVTLRRTPRHHRAVYPVRNVRVVTEHAAHRVRRWPVSSLPPGRSRILRLRVVVPSSARGRFCITATAIARKARGAAARDCTRVAG